MDRGVSPQADLFVYNIGQLCTMAGPARPRRGAEMADVGLVSRGALAARDGMILAAGPESEVRDGVALAPGALEVDAGGRVVTPGLWDPHTHLCYAGSREEEFAWRLGGRAYLEILAAGGGILSTVRATRAASDHLLLTLLLSRLDQATASGTTGIEIKSGYGLSTAEEIRLLRVIRAAAATHPVRVVPTFLGAHAVPPEFRGRTDDYTRLVIDEMIPVVAADGLAEFCDVFCEEGVFDLAQSRAILRAARQAGLGLKIHADEIAPMGGAELAAELGAVAADHLVHVSQDGIAAMAKAGVVAVLLPGTSLTLGSPYAPARELIAAGVPVALASDGNPGTSPTESLQAVLPLAARTLRLGPEEVLAAATVNAAWAVGRGRVSGTLEPGRYADFVIWDVPNYRYIPYHYGSNLAYEVYIGGRLAAREGVMVREQ